MKTLKANKNMVYCNGFTKTKIGGAIYLPENADASVWQEMTEADADALILKNNPDVEEGEEEPEATTEDYISALEKLGVSE